MDKAGNKAKAAERALDGEKLLKNALFYNPKLDGPDTLAKYNALLDEFERAPRPQAGRSQGEEDVGGGRHGLPVSSRPTTLAEPVPPKAEKT